MTAHQSEDYEALRSATENAMAAYAELAEVKAGNALLREALRLACEDGWDDGQWAMRRYIEMAQASLHRPDPKQVSGRWRVDCSCGWRGPVVPLPGHGTAPWTEHFTRRVTVGWRW
jgi:hypothetical protein